MISTERFKEYIKKEYDIDYVGIAAADALSEEPYGHRPEDVLPGAKSIIVLCRSIADGVIQARFRSFEGNVPSAYSSYASFGNNNAANFLLVDVVFNLANDIEKSFDAVAGFIKNFGSGKISPEDISNLQIEIGKLKLRTEETEKECAVLRDENSRKDEIINKLSAEKASLSKKLIWCTSVAVVLFVALIVFIVI